MEEIEKQLNAIVQACEDKKAIDIKILDVADKSSIADRFVVVSGNSSPQVKAISDAVEEAMYKEARQNFIREGYADARWVLLDYHNIIVHIFHKDEREFYDLERLWEEGN